MEQPSFVSSSCGSSYDVFLSFRGEDVRKNFVDHLYSAMQQRGIYTFKDDEELERGKSISPALEKAIEESSMAVVVFSEHYADSSWCLEEVVKIMECMEVKGQMVVPIFYGVDPSTVRKQMGKYGEAFEGHEKRFEKEGEKVKKWRKVLEDVSNLSGWDLNNTENGHEAKLIKRIVKDIIVKLGWSSEYPNLVGMKLRMQKLNSLIGLGCGSDVRFVGIFGMSGIGKTTIARRVYDEISNKFEGCCFIHEVKEQSAKHGMVHLQQKLLSEILSIEDLKISNVFEGSNMIKRRLCRKRVLIVLDDVDHMDQLESLARNGDWFGIGSRIIITTKDKHLLVSHRVIRVKSLRSYKMSLLDESESRKLFRQYAITKHPPAKEFKELETKLIRYAGGLPLALKVLGTSLCGRGISEWRSEVDRLKEIPENEIIEKLKGSFYGLNKNAQNIFLDIACFFNGKKKAWMIKKLDSFNFHPIIGIKVLTEKCLITVSNGRIWMHQMIQEMGWDVVRQEASNDPRRYSRLWLPRDISQLLTGSEGTEKIEGIELKLRYATEVKVSSEAFRHMTKLRLLKFHNANASQAPNFLPGELRWLDWHGYPSKCLPASFQGEKLVGLKMQNSRVIQLWKGLKVLENLRLINLSHSQKLIRTPDFTGIPNLERLILEDCPSLVEIHASVGFLKNLVLLNLKHCVNLKRLPTSIHLEKLEMLILSGCLKLANFPDITGRMDCLLEVHAKATALSELPSSIECLTCLSLINLSYCKHLVSLPSSICRLKGLKTLILSGCSKFDRLPDDLGEMECLEELYCDNTVIQEPPSSFSLLKKLKILTFHGCKPLASRSQHPFFLPRLLTGTTCQDIKASPSLSLSGLSSLIQLDLSDCSMLEGGVPGDLGELPCLQVLNLSNNKFVGIPAESLARLTRLKKLDLVACSKLETLPELPSSIQQLYTDECTDLKGNIDMFTKYPNLSRISFTKCLQLLQDQRCSHMADGIWQLLLKGLSIADRHFSIFFPGISIPECFTYKNLGRSIAADLPQNWYNDKFLGFAIFVPDWRGFTAYCRNDYVSEKYSYAVIFGYRTHDGRQHCVLTSIGITGTKQNVVSEHSCLAYLSYRRLSSNSRDYQNPNEWSQIVVDGFCENERTVGYGLQLVYEDDVKQAQAEADEQLMIQSN